MHSLCFYPKLNNLYICTLYFVRNIFCLYTCDYNLHKCAYFFSMIYSDFDAITDPIMKAKMVALKGINKMMVQNNMGMTSMVVNK